MGCIVSKKNLDLYIFIFTRPPNVSAPHYNLRYESGRVCSHGHLGQKLRTEALNEILNVGGSARCVCFNIEL